MTSAVHIPSFSMTRQNAEIRTQIMQAVGAVIDKGLFILGEEVQALEAQIASCCGTGFAVAVGSGSDALYLSLLACGVGPGDEVITTPFTFFSTAGAIVRTGAFPIFVDVDPATLNIDPRLIEQRITSRTKAIIPVHLYGCPAEMDPLMEIARRHQLRVIEDAAQALGARYKGIPVGGIGDAGCISFFPTKNLGAFGDGGMVVTNDPVIASDVRVRRVHGASVKYHHEVCGCNSRLDELQASILRVKLAYLDAWTKRRRTIARLYNGMLKSLVEREAVDLPSEPEQVHHVYHQYTIKTGQQRGLQAFLRDRGIGTTVYYPVPLHLQKALSGLGYRDGDFPWAERACREVLSLPMFPEMTDEEAMMVAQSVFDFFAGSAGERGR